MTSLPPKSAAALAVLLLCAAARPVAAEILVTEGWARATVPGATTGAGYFVIKNTGPEARTLLRLTTTVCDMLMLHQSSVDAQGIARMWPIAKLELAPGETLRFEPSGRHLMFMDLKAPLKAGDSVPVTFQFDRGERPVTAQFTVRPLVDGEPAVDHSKHAH